MTDLVEIAWIAGLLEGEGSFGCRLGLVIGLTMTDKDIVERAACLMGTKKVYEYSPKDNKRKRAYSLRINGYRAAAWMLTIYSFMGERRKEKIREIIAKWKKMKNVPRAMSGEPRPKIYASCHPTRLRYFKMICRECWIRIHNEREARKARLKRAQRIRCAETAELFK